MSRKISIIVPTYNVERYIRQTLDAMLAQTFQDFELIVVDDGSTDQTREIVRSYAPRVRLIEQSNQGVCAARNRGLRESTGEFVCFSDHDDFWFPEKLARQLEELRAPVPDCSPFLRSAAPELPRPLRRRVPSVPAVP